MQEKIYQVAVGLIPGVGAATTKTLISYCGCAEQIFKTPKGKLKNIPGIGAVTVDNIYSASVLHEAESIVERAQKLDTQLLFYTDPDYPNRLKQIPDAPTLLYYKGSSALNPPKSIAIVGTRKATEYGRSVVRKLLEEIASYKPLVVSGLAYGIDIQAHRDALELGLETIGVMANGTNIIYPSVHKNTALKMLEQGGLLSEYTFDSIAEPMRFPARNRIIAGMTDATIVIEATQSGGALITAEIADSYDREVLAVPGRITDMASEGCNNLIKQNKAHALTSAADLIELLNWDITPSQQAHKHIILADLEEDELMIYAVLTDNEGIHIDELSWKSQLSMQKISSVLLEMEFKGIVKALPGKKFSLR
ncbi:DNA-processing protein DprA [Cytophaga hutchinsonii]|jgi:DNA processing protein|uniref:DNA processing protein n=1 Tax=Cytophaga hutchinsonii (strain ATCC 33406 / DSM 1761 / CIP 103989 / NBRC 15051 / NCIMB 9469 / D465) TaxID=269798 RepID=A0A6N4SQZ2_CYTH3|nr:DNA-processing protein DprA [Cytophaga hutchinsonii]ABG58715.1 DNA processing protein [Cytophaga hutchinsonii ATCC 33406]SFX60230.1 DNA processing protein [Cytophaga hutchinsonii ATCC 33406]